MADLFRTRKFKDDEIVVCIESFAADLDGKELRIDKGRRLRGGTPVAKRWPEFFHRDGADAAEIQEQREAIFWKPENTARERADLAQRALRAQHEPAPIPLERQLQIRSGFRVGSGPTFAEGQIVDRDDPAIKELVREHPEHFAIPARPLLPA